MLFILHKGYKTYHKARVDMQKLTDTSENQFHTLFEAYMIQKSTNLIEQEIRKLLH